MPTVAARCEVLNDPDARVYELRRHDRGAAVDWVLAMKSPAAGEAPVLLPLPDAEPVLEPGRLTLTYRTQNGGRDIAWRIAPGVATLDVYANFELEVNVEADLDRRVELMNTEGPIANLSCAVLLPR